MAIFVTANMSRHISLQGIYIDVGGLQQDQRIGIFTECQEDMLKSHLGMILCAGIIVGPPERCQQI